MQFAIYYSIVFIDGNYRTLKHCMISFIYACELNVRNFACAHNALWPKMLKINSIELIQFNCWQL